MITLTADFDKAVRQIAAQLGGLAPKAPFVLAKAINETARQVRAMLAQKAQETYAVKSARFNRAARIKGASAGRPEAVIAASGAAMELLDFRVSPSRVPAGNLDRPDVVKGKVLKSSRLKPLKKGDLKAFVARFKSGHVAVVQRVGPPRLPVRKLLSPSIPQMLGSEERVYGAVRPQVEQLLQKNIQAEIDRLLGGAGP